MKRNGGFGLLIWPLLGLLIFAGLFFVKQAGMQYTTKPTNMVFVPEKILDTPKPALPKECVLIYNSKEPYSADFYMNIKFVLSSMSICYDTVDLASADFPELSAYKTAFFSFADLTTIQDSIPSLFRWVDGGGRLLFGISPEPSPAFAAISNKLGMIYSSSDFTVINKARLLTDIMPGGKYKEFTWGNDRYGLAVQLEKDCTVHMESEGDTQTPMLWERAYGKGKIVVNNNDAFCQKESRGLVAAAYSLLEDVCAYPVINASMFYIDDFPAPIPDGYNEYIYRDYKMSVDSFYINVWLPSVIKLENKYGLAITGMLVETYGDKVTGPFLPTQDIDRMKYFGDLLLEKGNEIGLHGYNHQPLVLDNFHYVELTYKKWNNVNDMASASSEAIRFAKKLFPQIELKTYIPPSNILSDEGRKMLKERFPQITAISGSYLSADVEHAYVQEFDVGSDGIVNVPRIITACNFTDYINWISLNEVNFHYVNSIFMHPDDSLDPERGAKDGWAKTEQNLDQYLGWLYGSAKGIRNLTAQDGAKAVQRYCNLKVEKTLTDGKLTLNLEGFYDEAWLMVRCNAGKPGLVDGGTILPVSDGLYLLHASKSQVVMAIGR